MSNEVKEIKEEVKKIELVVKECTTKEGGKFLAYKVVTKDGKYMDAKFRKELTPPTEDGFLYVKPSQMNIDKNRKYPVIWIKNFERFESKEELADGYISEEDFKKINDLF